MTPEETRARAAVTRLLHELGHARDDPRDGDLALARYHLQRAGVHITAHDVAALLWHVEHPAEIPPSEYSLRGLALRLATIVGRVP